MPPLIDITHCTNCEICVDSCPGDILASGAETPRVLYPDECWHCGACIYECPEGEVAIRLALPAELSAGGR